MSRRNAYLSERQDNQRSHPFSNSSFVFWKFIEHLGRASESDAEGLIQLCSACLVERTSVFAFGTKHFLSAIAAVSEGAHTHARATQTLNRPTTGLGTGGGREARRPFFSLFTNNVVTFVVLSSRQQINNKKKRKAGKSQQSHLQ